MNRHAVQHDRWTGAANSLFWRIALTTLMIGTAAEVCAAGATVMNLDRNLLMRIDDTLVVDKHTWLLYDTVPDVTQAHAGEPCTTNFYLLNLQRDLAQVRPQLLAENYCGTAGMTGTLLANGNVVIIAGDRVETWKPGSGKVKAWQLSDVAALQGKWHTINAGNTPLDVSPAGHIVIARDLPRLHNDSGAASVFVAGLTGEGAVRWQLTLQAPGELLDIQRIWSTAEGGALVFVTARPLAAAGLPGVAAPVGAIITDQQRLYRVSAAGELSPPVILASSRQVDFSQPMPLPDRHKDPAGYKAAFARQQQFSRLESIGQIGARPQDGDVMDVLLQRASTRQHRAGTFLYRIDRAGDVASTTALTASMNVDGLERWTDFNTTRNQVILYGVIGTRRDRLPQGYLSWIDIPDDGIVTHLVPLSLLGLETAKTARDEEIKSLVDNPSQDPQRLSSLAGKPLTVSIVVRSHRAAIQLDEGLVDGPEALTIYTEARDVRQARAIEAHRRKQRAIERDARHQELNDELAAAVDVIADEFTAMSNRERKETMLRNGDMNPMMAATQKQMAQAQQTLTALNKRMANPSSDTDTQTHAVIRLNEHRRGLVEFHHPDGDLVTLLISNRVTGEELLKTSYPDGTVLAYIDFSRFALPLDKIRVVYLAEDQKVLGKPALKIEN